MLEIRTNFVFYLLPMMNPKTMNTKMMVPATATTAIIITGFCSLETAVAINRKEKRLNKTPNILQALEVKQNLINKTAMLLNSPLI